MKYQRQQEYISYSIHKIDCAWSCVLQSLLVQTTTHVPVRFCTNSSERGYTEFVSQALKLFIRTSKHINTRQHFVREMNVKKQDHPFFAQDKFLILNSTAIHRRTPPKILKKEKHFNEFKFRHVHTKTLANRSKTCGYRSYHKH